MANFYSDHFRDEGLIYDDRSDTKEQGFIAGPAIGNGTVLVKNFKLQLDIGGTPSPPQAGDIARCATFRTGDRILWSEFRRVNNSGETGILEAGFYKVGTDHDGAVVDSDCWIDAMNLASSFGSGLLVTQSPAGWQVTDRIRGTPLWSLAGTNSKDPFELWDFALTVTTNVSATGTGLGLQGVIYYVSQG